MPGIFRVDHFVDFKRGGKIHGLAAIVHLGHPLFVFNSSLLWVGDRFKFFSVAEFDCALKAHAPKLAGGPGDGKGGCLKAAAGHRLRAEAVAFAQHNRKQGHGEARAGHKDPTGMPHQGGFFRFPGQP